MESPKSSEEGKTLKLNLLFRNVCPTDLQVVNNLERSSYPKDEAASRSQLQYRQHQAASFFRCVVLMDETEASVAQVDRHGEALDHSRNSLNSIGKIVGYVTATRCHQFTEKSMKTHDPTGPLLAIHSLVIDSNQRRQGYGAALMKNYIETLMKMKLKYGIERVVLMAKADKLAFYVNAGFQVTGKSSIVHGQQPWYNCEMELNLKGSTERKSPCWIVDSFAIHSSGGNGSGNNTLIGAGGAGNTSYRKGSGNPAAVVVVPNATPMRRRSTSSSNLAAAGSNHASLFDPTFEDNVNWMKVVAREFNLSETAFIWQRTAEEDNSSRICYNIRFYTCNGTEVDLCGHATLAASSVIFKLLAKEGRKGDDIAVSFYANNKVILKTRPATTSQIGPNSNMKVVMDFPTKKLVPFEDNTESRSQVVDMLRKALDIEDIEKFILYLGVDVGGDDLLVEVTDEGFSTISSYCEEINFKAMLEFSGYNRGVIICCEVSDDYRLYGETADFMSRFFGPKVGIEEDPVTGSAHCILGPYFAKKLEKTTVIGAQKSRRGGIVECMMREDGIVRISGTAVTVMTGNLHI
jgi:PhzF family phenazine biosynthesis protein